MKNVMILTLAAAIFTLQAADSFFRTDVDGEKEQIELSATGNEAIKIIQPLKDGVVRKCLFFAVSSGKVSNTGWQEYKFSFIPSKSGKLNIALKGQWSQKVENRGWIAVARIVINGKLMENGDFKKTWIWKARNNKVVPNGFILNGSAEYLRDGGKGANPAVMVNHDNSMMFSLNVVGGQTYAVECLVKAASSDSANKQP